MMHRPIKRLPSSHKIPQSIVCPTKNHHRIAKAIAASRWNKSQIEFSTINHPLDGHILRRYKDPYGCTTTTTTPAAVAEITLKVKTEYKTQRSPNRTTAAAPEMVSFYKNAITMQTLDVVKIEKTSLNLEKQICISFIYTDNEGWLWRRGVRRIKAIAHLICRSTDDTTANEDDGPVRSADATMSSRWLPVKKYVSIARPTRSFQIVYDFGLMGDGAPSHGEAVDVQFSTQFYRKYKRYVYFGKDFKVPSGLLTFKNKKQHDRQIS
ncbi:hypothetical protein RP20_CCG014664 [Aedes albopictus]|nr:hypothetical protein RP20_CCG014664 [Aedes albopictus]